MTPLMSAADLGFVRLRQLWGFPGGSNHPQHAEGEGNLWGFYGVSVGFQWDPVGFGGFQWDFGEFIGI